MKRLTKQIKKLDLIATLIDIVYAFLGILFIIKLFVMLVQPEEIDQVLNTTYNLFGFTTTSAQMNTLISLMIGYLIVFVPLAFSNLKRVRNKETIEMDEWTYRTQFLYMFMSFFTFNPFSAVIRYFAGFEIKKIVDGQNFVETMKSIWTSIKLLFNGTTFKKWNEKRKNQALVSESQHDLEKIGRKDMIKKVFILIATYSFLTFVALFIFIPFYWMIITALKTNQELTTALNPRLFIGISEMQWINFKIALTRFDFWIYMKNTIVVGLVSMVGTVTTTILAAFAFSRLDFKGRDFIFSILLMTMMIPGELYTITNYITIRNLSWYDRFPALVFPFMTSVFYIFFLRQSFKQIPDTLYRAAQVDGCGDFKYLTRVMIPIAKPTITTITILSAIGAWDAYIWPQLVAPSQKNWLISVALRSTSFTTGPDARPLYNIQLAATALVTVPLLIIFFSLKKYIIAGVGRSGTKG